MIVDATAPTVNGLENNKTYCGDVKFTVTDEHLDKVTDTIGEETKTLEAVDGEYTLSAGTHKITATDKAGNKTEVQFGGASLDTNKEDLIAAKGIFTPEEKAEVENGVNARIWVEISSTENITEENRQKIEALAKKLMGSDISNLTYFDAELFKSVTKDGVSTKSQINELGAHIEISVILTDNKKHDNQKVISSKTGDTSDVTLWITVFAAALAGIIGIFVRRKKEKQ